MEIHWMCRAVRGGFDPAERGTLICYEDPGIPRRVQVRFILDREEGNPQDFWLEEPPTEPEPGEDVVYESVEFRVYGKMEASGAKGLRITRATIKMPMRAR